MFVRAYPWLTRLPQASIFSRLLSRIRKTGTGGVAPVAVQSVGADNGAVPSIPSSVLLGAAMDLYREDEAEAMAIVPEFDKARAL